ncbi:MAG: hypothetical protein JKY52_08455 [Flavobacteriales bacterium]|nr:hypothetical protein [Flavobacteriales bacterium]
MEDAVIVNVDGVKFSCTHAGQKRRYGDCHYEYTANSDKGADHVKAVMLEHAYKCSLTREQWKNEERASMDKHFRSSYEFEDKGNGEYFYRVTLPSTH